MTDLANESAPVKKTIPRWIWWVGGIIATLVAVFLFLPFYGEASPKSIRSLNLSQAKGVFGAVRMYASDHEGKYPPALAVLVPDYLTISVKYLQDWGGRQDDWFYVSGLSKSSPADWIVLASPTDRIFGNSEWRFRIVVYNDARGLIVSTDEFDRKLAAQLKAMAAQTSEKP